MGYVHVVKFIGGWGDYVHVVKSIRRDYCLFVLLLYVPSQQLWSLRDGQFTKPHFFLGRLEQAVNQ